MKPLTMLIFSAFFFAFPVFAEDAGLITTTGEGRIAVRPDVAQISLGVSSRNAEAGVALDETSQKVASVIDLLLQAGIAESDIRTTHVSLSPLRAAAPRDENIEPQITGFQASNVLTVTVVDVSLLGSILDLVVQTGANTLNGLRFSVQDPAPYLAQAREAAVLDARARADQLASAAGVRLGDIQSINEHSGRGVPMMEMSAARVSDVPVAPGTITISAQVTIAFEIEQ